MLAAANLFLCQRGKPALNLVEPRCRCRSEVHMESGMTYKPSSHGRRFVCPVIVHDQMDVEVIRHIRFNGAQELQELGATVKTMPSALLAHSRIIRERNASACEVLRRRAQELS